MPAKKKKQAAQDVHTPPKRQKPSFVAPMAAVSVDALPEGPEWSYELKLDGTRTLAGVSQKKCPFVDLPGEGSSRWGGGVSEEDMKAMVWTKPKLVVQIQFVEWTAENRLRHWKFLGLRSDKAAEDVRHEK